MLETCAHFSSHYHSGKIFKVVAPNWWDLYLITTEQMVVHLSICCREIWQRYKNTLSEKDDVHTRLMRAYKEVPQAYFVGLLISMIIISILGCEIFIDQLQLRWWGVLLACGIAFFFTLPLGVICATTNQVSHFHIYLSSFWFCSICHRESSAHPRDKSIICWYFTFLFEVLYSCRVLSSMHHVALQVWSHS